MDWARREPRGTSIAGRLLFATMLIVVTAGLTSVLVASLVGPRIFNEHLEMYEQGPGTFENHAGAAFVSAGAVTIGVAIGVSVLVALLVSVLFARRVSSSLRAMRDVATEVADGRFAVHVTPPRIGTEFDELAEAFNRMGARLGQAEALRRRLMADVAHELRTPVATISGYVDAIEEGVTELTPQTADILRAQAARLTRLASDLAEVTRAESGALPVHHEPVAPADLATSAVAAARPRFDAKSVTLTLVPEPDMPHLDGDRDRLGQVLGNLLDNALRHTHPGDEVELAVRQSPDGIELTVKDSGDGIASEHLPHLFERFYRVDEARDRASGGSGIGLAIVRAIVEAHGGHITAHSDGPHTGATFRVTLPLSRD